MGIGMLRIDFSNIASDRHLKELAQALRSWFFFGGKLTAQSNFASSYWILEWNSALESYARETIWLSLAFSDQIAEF